MDVSRRSSRSVLGQPLEVLLAVFATGLGSLYVHELDRRSVAAAPPAFTPCEDARPGLIWPLGTDGYEPRKLYSTHDQFQEFGGSPSVHQGIDIGACEDEWVYAAASGRVVLSFPSGVYDGLVVSDGDDLSKGFKYQHLKDIQFTTGQCVERDDALGKVRNFTPFSSFDHVHFQFVQKGCGADPPPCDDWVTEVDAGNPLLLFPARMDSARPTVHDLGPANSRPGPLLFFKDNDKASALDPNALNGSVDIVGCVTERFPDGAATACPSAAGCSQGFSTDVAPYRLTVSVLWDYEASSTSNPCVPQRVLYHNSIRLDGPSPDVMTAADLPSFYRSDGVGNYTEDRPLFVLTHCANSGGSWNTASGLENVTLPVDLEVELVVEDTSGNVTVETMDVTVTSPP
jgi:murein DD-endopeptidase MepM/ murein hydrolase activator NlpD